MGLKDLFTTADHTNEYECENCGERFETELSAHKTLACPDCDSEEVRRIEDE
jgi:putative FmdB family regulatory protein